MALTDAEQKELDALNAKYGAEANETAEQPAVQTEAAKDGGGDGFTAEEIGFLQGTGELGNRFREDEVMRKWERLFVPAGMVGVDPSDFYWKVAPKIDPYNRRIEGVDEKGEWTREGKIDQIRRDFRYFKANLAGGDSVKKYADGEFGKALGMTQAEYSEMYEKDPLGLMNRIFGKGYYDGTAVANEVFGSPGKYDSRNGRILTHMNTTPFGLMEKAGNSVYWTEATTEEERREETELAKKLVNRWQNDSRTVRTTIGGVNIRENLMQMTPEGVNALSAFLGKRGDFSEAGGLDGLVKSFQDRIHGADKKQVSEVMRDLKMSCEVLKAMHLTVGFKGADGAAERLFQGVGNTIVGEAKAFADIWGGLKGFFKNRFDDVAELAYLVKATGVSVGGRQIVKGDPLADRKLNEWRLQKLIDNSLSEAGRAEVASEHTKFGELTQGALDVATLGLSMGSMSGPTMLKTVGKAMTVAGKATKAVAKGGKIGRMATAIERGGAKVLSFERAEFGGVKTVVRNGKKVKEAVAPKWKAAYDEATKTIMEYGDDIASAVGPDSASKIAAIEARLVRAQEALKASNPKLHALVTECARDVPGMLGIYGQTIRDTERADALNVLPDMFDENGNFSMRQDLLEAAEKWEIVNAAGQTVVFALPKFVKKALSKGTAPKSVKQFVEELRSAFARGDAAAVEGYVEGLKLARLSGLLKGTAEAGGVMAGIGGIGAATEIGKQMEIDGILGKEDTEGAYSPLSIIDSVAKQMFASAGKGALDVGLLAGAGTAIGAARGRIANGKANTDAFAKSEMGIGRDWLIRLRAMQEITGRSVGMKNLPEDPFHASKELERRIKSEVGEEEYAKIDKAADEGLGIIAMLEADMLGGGAEKAENVEAFNRWKENARKQYGDSFVKSVENARKDVPYNGGLAFSVTQAVKLDKVSSFFDVARNADAYSDAEIVGAFQRGTGIPVNAVKRMGDGALHLVVSAPSKDGSFDKDGNIVGGVKMREGAGEIIFTNGRIDVKRPDGTFDPGFAKEAIDRAYDYSAEAAKKIEALDAERLEALKGGQDVDGILTELQNAGAASAGVFYRNGKGTFKLGNEFTKIAGEARVNSEGKVVTESTFSHEGTHAMLEIMRDTGVLGLDSGLKRTVEKDGKKLTEGMTYEDVLKEYAKIASPKWSDAQWEEAIAETLNEAVLGKNIEAEIEKAFEKRYDPSLVRDAARSVGKFVGKIADFAKSFVKDVPEPKSDFEAFFESTRSTVEKLLDAETKRIEESLKTKAERDAQQLEINKKFAERLKNPETPKPEENADAPVKPEPVKTETAAEPPKPLEAKPGETVKAAEPKPLTETTEEPAAKAEPPKAEMPADEAKRVEPPKPEEAKAEPVKAEEPKVEEAAPEGATPLAVGEAAPAVKTEEPKPLTKTVESGAEGAEPPKADVANADYDARMEAFTDALTNPDRPSISEDVLPIGTDTRADPLASEIVTATGRKDIRTAMSDCGYAWHEGTRTWVSEKSDPAAYHESTADAAIEKVRNGLGAELTDFERMHLGVLKDELGNTVKFIANRWGEIREGTDIGIDERDVEPGLEVAEFPKEPTPDFLEAAKKAFDTSVELATKRAAEEIPEEKTLRVTEKNGTIEAEEVKAEGKHMLVSKHVADAILGKEEADRRMAEARRRIEEFKKKGGKNGRVRKAGGGTEKSDGKGPEGSPEADASAGAYAAARRLFDGIRADLGISRDEKGRLSFDFDVKLKGAEEIRKTIERGAVSGERNGDTVALGVFGDILADDSPFKYCPRLSEVKLVRGFTDDGSAAKFDKDSNTITFDSKEVDRIYAGGGVNEIEESVRHEFKHATDLFGNGRSYGTEVVEQSAKAQERYWEISKDAELKRSVDAIKTAANRMAERAIALFGWLNEYTKKHPKWKESRTFKDALSLSNKLRTLVHELEDPGTGRKTTYTLPTIDTFVSDYSGWKNLFETVKAKGMSAFLDNVVALARDKRAVAEAALSDPFARYYYDLGEVRARAEERGDVGETAAVETSDAAESPIYEAVHGKHFGRTLQGKDPFYDRNGEGKFQLVAQTGATRLLEGINGKSGSENFKVLEEAARGMYAKAKEAAESAMKAAAEGKRGRGRPKQADNADIERQLKDVGNRIKVGNFEFAVHFSGSGRDERPRFEYVGPSVEITKKMIDGIKAGEESKLTVGSVLKDEKLAVAYPEIFNAPIVVEDKVPNVGTAIVGMRGKKDGGLVGVQNMTVGKFPQTQIVDTKRGRTRTVMAYAEYPSVKKLAKGGANTRPYRIVVKRDALNETGAKNRNELLAQDVAAAVSDMILGLEGLTSAGMFDVGRWNEMYGASGVGRWSGRNTLFGRKARQDSMEASKAGFNRGLFYKVFALFGDPKLNLDDDNSVLSKAIDGFAKDIAATMKSADKKDADTVKEQIKAAVTEILGTAYRRFSSVMESRAWGKTFGNGELDSAIEELALADEKGVFVGHGAGRDGTRKNTTPWASAKVLKFYREEIDAAMAKMFKGEDFKKPFSEYFAKEVKRRQDVRAAEGLLKHGVKLDNLTQYEVYLAILEEVNRRRRENGEEEIEPLGKYDTQRSFDWAGRTGEAARGVGRPQGISDGAPDGVVYSLDAERKGRRGDSNGTYKDTLTSGETPAYDEVEVPEHVNAMKRAYKAKFDDFMEKWIDKAADDIIELREEMKGRGNAFLSEVRKLLMDDKYYGISSEYYDDALNAVLKKVSEKLAGGKHSVVNVGPSARHQSTRSLIVEYAAAQLARMYNGQHSATWNEKRVAADVTALAKRVGVRASELQQFVDDAVTEARSVAAAVNAKFGSIASEGERLRAIGRMVKVNGVKRDIVQNYTFGNDVGRRGGYAGERAKEIYDQGVKSRQKRARGFAADQMDRLLGTDFDRWVDTRGAAGNPYKDAKSLADRMLAEFVKNVPTLDAQTFTGLTEEEIKSSKVGRSEFAKSVATWLERTARKLAWGELREDMLRKAIALRAAVRSGGDVPTMESVREIVEMNVDRLGRYLEENKKDFLVDQICKFIDENTDKARKQEQQLRVVDRKASPLLAEYWGFVKKAIGMTNEAAEMRMRELENALGKTSAEALSESDVDPADPIVSRRRNLIEYKALSQYGGLSALGYGEIMDAFNTRISAELSGDAAAFAAVQDGRIALETKYRDTLVKAITDARTRLDGETDKTGGKGKMSRRFLLANVPDLSRRLSMYFPENDPTAGGEMTAFDCVEEFRRNLSQSHIRHHDFKFRYENEFRRAYRDIMGRDFEDDVAELQRKRPEYMRFSRTAWYIPEGSDVAVAQDGTKPTNLPTDLSMENLLFIYGSRRQADMAENNRIWGCDAAYMRDLEDTIRRDCPNGLRLVDWMCDAYGRMRDEADPICFSVTGMHILSPVDNYMPLSFVQQKVSADTNRYSVNPFPAFLTRRVNHDKARLDEGRGLCRTFEEHVEDTGHYVGFAELTDVCRGTFLDRDVQTAYAQLYGTKPKNDIYAQLSDALTGGRRDPGELLNGVRNFVTATSLFGNFASAVKQIEGIAGWAMPMGVRNWTKSIFVNRWTSREVADAYTELVDAGVFRMRKEEGISEAMATLIESIDGRGDGGRFRRLYNSYKKHGMDLTTFVDQIASRSMAAQYMVQRRKFYEQNGFAHDAATRMAIADTDYEIQETQQSGRPEFFHRAQRMGAAGKILTQFSGPSLVRWGVEVEALHRAFVLGDAGAKKKLLSKMIALHLMCGSALSLSGAVGRMLFGTNNKDDSDESEEIWGDCAMKMLQGPLGGWFVWGNVINATMDGAVLKNGFGGMRRYEVPVISRLSGLCEQTAKIFGELLDGNGLGDFDVEMSDEVIDETVKLIEMLLPAARNAHGILENTGAIER